jgi:hypothetical protein
MIGPVREPGRQTNFTMNLALRGRCAIVTGHKHGIGVPRQFPRAYVLVKAVLTVNAVCPGGIARHALLVDSGSRALP